MPSLGEGEENIRERLKNKRRERTTLLVSLCEREGERKGGRIR